MRYDHRICALRRSPIKEVLTVAFPFVPLVVLIGSAVTASGGFAAGSVGSLQIRRAQIQMKAHSTRYENRYVTHRSNVKSTNMVLQAFGRRQDEAQRDVIVRMKNFLLRHEKQVRLNEHLILAGVDGATNRVVGIPKLDFDVASWIQGLVGSIVAGGSTPFALCAAATKLANATTGTPISTLSGAARKNSTLAFFGGGSLKSGGGGMKLGGTVLNIATVGPGILIAGVTVKNQGTKARTEAEEHRAEVEIAIAHLDARDELLRGVRKRSSELEEVLKRLVAQAAANLNLLESEELDMAIHAERLQAAIVLVRSVGAVSTAPISDEGGNLDENSEQLIFKYREKDERASHA